MIREEWLSDHFRLEEFLRSETAARMGIANEPEDWQLANLRLNAMGMEMVRDLLCYPVHVLSGLRVEALERVLTQRDFPAWCARRGIQVDAEAWKQYFATKAHPLGLATDFVCPAFGMPLAICRAIAASDLPFDKLIFEHGWVHIAWPGAGDTSKREVFTLMPGNSYAQGIVEKEAA